VLADADNVFVMEVRKVSLLAQAPAAPALAFDDAVVIAAEGDAEKQA